MHTDGALGEAPDWWFLIRAARYLGVSPWELAEQPLFWRNAALVTQDVEIQYENDVQERQQRQG